MFLRLFSVAMAFLILHAGSVSAAVRQNPKPVNKPSDSIEVALHDSDHGRYEDDFLERAGDLPIGAIEISGLERTRVSVIRDAMGVSEGELLSRFNADAFVQNIYRTGIFKKIEIGYRRSGDSVDILVKLDEKWTIIPIPFMKASNNGYGGGLFLSDANFMGYNKKLMTGFMYANTGWLGFMFFSSPSVSSSGIIYGLNAMGGNNESRNTDIRENVFQRYKAKSYMTGADIGYSFSPKFSVQLTGGSRGFIISDDYPESFNRPDTAIYSREGVKMAVNNTRLSAIRSVGFIMNSEFNVYHNHTRGGNDGTFKTMINYSMMAFGSDVISAYTSFGAARADNLLLDRIGGKPCFKSLPSEYIISNRYAGAGVSYEMLLKDTQSVGLYLLAQAEAGTFHRMESRGGYESFVGYGGGLKLYLKGVAFPAVSGEVMRNQRTGDYQFLAAMGFSM
jgi:hypothetical protein